MMISHFSNTASIVRRPVLVQGDVMSSVFGSFNTLPRFMSMPNIAELALNVDLSAKALPASEGVPDSGSQAPKDSQMVHTSSNALKTKLTLCQHRILALEAEVAALKAGAQVKEQEISTLKTDLFMARFDLEASRQHRQLDEQKIEFQTMKLFQAERFIECMVDIKLDEPVLHRAVESMHDGMNADDALIDAIKKAAGKRDSSWARIIPAIVGPRTPDNYISAINHTLKARKDLRSTKKVAKFWKQQAQTVPNHADIVTPSSSALSDILSNNQSSDSLGINTLMGCLERGEEPPKLTSTAEERQEMLDKSLDVGISPVIYTPRERASVLEVSAEPLVSSQVVAIVSSPDVLSVPVAHVDVPEPICKPVEEQVKPLPVASRPALATVDINRPVQKRQIIRSSRELKATSISKIPASPLKVKRSELTPKPKVISSIKPVPAPKVVKPSPKPTVTSKVPSSPVLSTPPTIKGKPVLRSASPLKSLATPKAIGQTKASSPTVSPLNLKGAISRLPRSLASPKVQSAPQSSPKSSLSSPSRFSADPFLSVQSKEKALLDILKEDNNQETSPAPATTEETKDALEMSQALLSLERICAAFSSDSLGSLEMTDSEDESVYEGEDDQSTPTPKYGTKPQFYPIIVEQHVTPTRKSLVAIVESSTVKSKLPISTKGRSLSNPITPSKKVMPSIHSVLQSSISFSKVSSPTTMVQKLPTPPQSLRRRPAVSPVRTNAQTSIHIPRTPSNNIKHKSSASHAQINNIVKAAEPSIKITPATPQAVKTPVTPRPSPKVTEPLRITKKVAPSPLRISSIPAPDIAPDSATVPVTPPASPPATVASKPRTVLSRVSRIPAQFARLRSGGASSTVSQSQAPSQAKRVSAIPKGLFRVATT